MSSTAYCPSCERVVYIGREEQPYCPVCASPLGEEREKYEPEAAAVRIVENETLFREVNEIAMRSEYRRDSEEKLGFVCECGQQSCTEVVYLTRDEYEAVRKSGVTFFTVPGHEVPGLEVVRERREGYQLVEKVGPPRRIAEERARRSDGEA